MLRLLTSKVEWHAMLKPSVFEESTREGLRSRLKPEVGSKDKDAQRRHEEEGVKGLSGTVREGRSGVHMKKT